MANFPDDCPLDYILTTRHSFFSRAGCVHLYNYLIGITLSIYVVPDFLIALLFRISFVVFVTSSSIPSTTAIWILIMSLFLTNYLMCFFIFHLMSLDYLSLVLRFSSLSPCKESSRSCTYVYPNFTSFRLLFDYSQFICGPGGVRLNLEVASERFHSYFL